jgi:hypothetical protein
LTVSSTFLAIFPHAQRHEKRNRRVVSHGRYVAFQMAVLAIPRNLFANILRLITELRPPPAAVST